MKNKMNKELRKKVLEELKSELGENATDNEAVRASYRGGFVGALPLAKLPDFVCRPKNIEDVKAVLSIANKYRIPVTPQSSGMLLLPTFPLSGGIVVDMMGMDRILEINTNGGYALIEPGVTFNQLIPELKKIGWMVPCGSYPGSISVLGNLVGHRTPGVNVGIFPSHVVGVEIVLPNGKIIRTGTATYGDYWSDHAYFTPDLKGIFSPSIGNLGIITKAAVRIYPRGEVQALPIAVFANFDSAFEYCRRVVRSLLAYQAMVYHWRMLPFLQWATGEISIFRFMELMQFHRGPKAPKGYDYNYCTLHMMGYREQVEGNMKSCGRIATELGGKLLSEEEFSARFPGVWKEWKHAYVDHNPELVYLKGTAFGSIDTLVFLGDVDSLKKLEQPMFELLKNYNFDSVSYYTRMVDQGRYAHLRYMTLSDTVDEQQIAQTLRMRREIMEWLKKNNPGVILLPPAETTGTSYLMKEIKKIVDPNDIMNPYWKSKLPFG